MAAVELQSTALRSSPNLQQYFQLESTTAQVGSNLTNTGTTPFNPAKFNNGADFGSTNTTKYLNNTNDPNSYSFLTASTINFWFKPPANPSGSARWQIGGIYSDAAHVNIRIDYVDNAGTPNIEFKYQKTGTSDHNVTSVTTLPTGSFSFLTITYNGSQIEGFLNAVSQGTLSVSGGGGGTFGTSGTAIGAGINGGNKSDGIVDDFSVFNSVLSGANITGLYSGFTTPSAMLSFF